MYFPSQPGLNSLSLSAERIPIQCTQTFSWGENIASLDSHRALLKNGMAQGRETQKLKSNDLIDKYKRRPSNEMRGGLRDIMEELGQNILGCNVWSLTLALTGTQKIFVEWKPAGKLSQVLLYMQIFRNIFRKISNV